MIGDFAYIFIQQLAICLSFFGEMSIRVLYPFLSGCLFAYYWVVLVHFIFKILTHYRLYGMIIFSPIL
jgi:hypothetical protein